MAEVFEHGYAIVVGVDDNNIKRLALPSVAKDVQAIHDVLIHPERCAYKPENVKLLMGADSTNRDIMDAVYWLQDKVKADPQATAVIYYSGHGMVDKKTNEYYLIPYDIRELKKVRADAIKAETMTAEISDIAAPRLLVILDCCHSAGMGVKDVDLDAIDSGTTVESAPFPIDQPATKDIPAYEAAPGANAKAVSDLLEGEGRAILNSSTGAQSSYVRKDGAMSLFTYHLIEALTGHAPHPDDATVVYVTDVMSWVTHEVKKSAQSERVEQTPVMKTSGVFPVAQLIGGQGMAKGLGAIAPDPLAPLPSIQMGDVGGSAFIGDVNAGGHVAGGDVNVHEGDVFHGNVDQSTTNTTTNNTTNNTVDGPQYNLEGNAQIGQIGNNINTGGGTYVGGDQNIQGDMVNGDKVAGDKVGGDKISVGNISGGTGIAIGSNATANVSQTTVQSGSDTSFAQLFAPLQTLVAQANPALVGKVNDLKTQVQAGSGADDKKIARLISDIGDGVPSSKSKIAAIFKDPTLSAIAAGPRTEFVLEDFS